MQSSAKLVPNMSTNHKHKIFRTLVPPTINREPSATYSPIGYRFRDYSGILVLRNSGLKKPALEFALISLFFKKLEAGPGPPMFKKKGLACASIVSY